MSSRVIPLILLATTFVACKAKTVTIAALPTTTVARGEVNVRVAATGVVEPINPVDIKSKASGMVIQLPVEIGSMVKRTQLLAQVDPRDVKNEFDQSMADDVVAYASLEAALKNRSREDSLYVRHVITASEHDSTAQTISSARSDMVNASANLDLARQNLEDATVRAPIDGTIVSRPITEGAIITSANSPNGGTTLMTVADLGSVRMRISIDEVEMANVHPGEAASVKVDAFPDSTFTGVVEKIEPQAVVTQGVTFFPVLVNISNKDGLLMPGMNGEVTIHGVDLSNVVEIPIDAMRPTNELAPVSRMFQIPVDTLINDLRADLVAGEGTTGIPGRYVVVALPNGTYEMRLIKVGPTDLRVIQVTGGLKEGDNVVMLGSIMINKPPVPPTLQIAADMKRGAPATQEAAKP